MNREPHKEPPIESNPIESVSDNPQIVELVRGFPADPAATAEDVARFLNHAATVEATATEDVRPETNFMRMRLIQLLFYAGRNAEAFGILQAITLPHDEIAIRVELAVAQGLSLHDVSVDIDASHPPGAPKRAGVIRALRDYCVEYEAFDLAAELDGVLGRAGIEEDPLEGWAESAAAAHKGLIRPGTVEYLRSDEDWGDLPMHYRQHAMLMHHKFKDFLFGPGPVDRETLHRYIFWLDQYRIEYPDVPFWDKITQLTTVEIVDKDPEAGVVLGASIQDSMVQGSLVVEWIEENREDVAEALIMQMSDYATACVLLLDGNWRDDERGLNVIERVLFDESASRMQRIGFAELLRDRTKAQGAPDLEFYESLLERLRSQDDAG